VYPHDDEPIPVRIVDIYRPTPGTPDAERLLKVDTCIFVVLLVLGLGGVLGFW